MGKLYFEQALLPDGWRNHVAVEVDAQGFVAVITPDAQEPGQTFSGIALPGMPNLHSHAFQRGMAGLAETPSASSDSFWTWRQVMYRFLDRLTPDDIEVIATWLYIEMLEAGFTSVGEFHYLHHAADGQAYADPAEMAGRIAAAANATGIGLTLLPVFYANGGFGGEPVEGPQRRFASDLDLYGKLHEGAERHIAKLPHAAVGIAPHSLRAVTPETLLSLTATYKTGPVHIHVAEQTKEVDDCLAWSGKRPVDWLLGEGLLDPRWCLIHATHMTEAETNGLAISGAVAGLCPTTEANLGDGIFDGVNYLRVGGRFGIGTDSHIRVDVAEELRSLDYSQRLRDRRRNVLAPSAGVSSGLTLYTGAATGGAAALGRPCGALQPGNLADIIVLDQSHRALAGRTGNNRLDSFVFSADRSAIRDVYVAGRQVVSDGRHFAAADKFEKFRAAMHRLAN